MYANGAPHVGYALELIQADVVARYHRQRLGSENVRFLTGTDEHGTTVVRAAEKLEKSPQDLVDEVSDLVQDLAQKLKVSHSDFIRTTDQKRHWPGAVKIWKALQAADALYKKEYEGLYCVGHEAFIKKSELEDGKCPLHKTEPERIKEENWFFSLTKYKDAIHEKIEKDELHIVPETRKKEILNLFSDAEDVSFSRPSQDLTWGIPVPEDPSQTMYVWVDALTNYISALGYGTDEKNMKFWPASVHLIGKDILRFHAMIWPAMLLAANIELPKAIYVHGFITVEGQKMSKTVGNIIDPFQLLEKYNPEIIRYFLLREIPSGDDGDFSYKNLESRYNSDLANGLGNLTARVLTLAAREEFNGNEVVTEKVDFKIKEIKATVEEKISQFKLHEALASIWELLAFGDAYVNETQAWKREDKNVIFSLVTLLDNAAFLLQPFMPETAEKITKRIVWEGSTLTVKAGDVLFPRRT
jgi:methionyl-tRNA synthetase